MDTIISYIRPHLKRMTIGLSFKVFGSFMDLALPWILAYIIDYVITKGQISSIFLWGFVMLVCSILAVVCNILANRSAAAVARDTTGQIRNDLFSKISYLSCAQVDEKTMPSLISRMTTDTYNIHQMVGMMQRLGVRAPILLVGGIMITFTMDPVLTLVLVSILPFILLLVWQVSRHGVPQFRLLQKKIDAMVLKVREIVSGIRVIKALSKTDVEESSFEKINQNVRNTETKATIIMSLTNPTMNFLLNIGLVLVILVGAYRVNRGEGNVGSILAFLTYFSIILNAMMALTRMFIVYSKSSASAERIKEILLMPQDLVQQESQETKNDVEIEFDHVSFHYLNQNEMFSNLSFQLHRGQHLGIIGATGSGKTTLINLLMRFYDPQEGIIRLCGQDIRTMDSAQLRERFGVVFQNDVLFEDTVANNIDFGRDITQEQREKAARSAQAEEFIEQLPDHFDYPLAIKGSNLSGGQKQRVLLSRALASQPEFLILDDSSSALDYRTDAQLRKALQENYQKTTTVIIAQRVSSIKHCDQILVLDEGKIIGRGNHEELMQSSEVYRQIACSQMGE